MLQTDMVRDMPIDMLLSTVLADPNCTGVHLNDGARHGYDVRAYQNRTFPGDRGYYVELGAGAWAIAAGIRKPQNDQGVFDNTNLKNGSV